MLDTLQFMFLPFITSVLVVGMHSYLGIHVLKRGIIFVDLALAQMAALGTIVGIIFGFMPGDQSLYYFSLGTVFLGAIIISVIRSRDPRIPQEAIIGIVYGLSIAVAMAIADKISAGGQHIKETLTGNLLWVTWDNVFRIAIVYIVIAIFHFIFRNKFIHLTENYKNKQDAPLDRMWDFMFFVSFGMVITMSVPIAGVLLVFSFLMIPAAIAVLYSENWKSRILVGWIVGIGSCLIGFWYSYTFNAPCGPATVCILAIILIFSAITKKLHKGKGSTITEGAYDE